jgi:hypothetical protein
MLVVIDTPFGSASPRLIYSWRTGGCTTRNIGTTHAAWYPRTTLQRFLKSRVVVPIRELLFEILRFLASVNSDGGHKEKYGKAGNKCGLSCENNLINWYSLQPPSLDAHTALLSEYSAICSILRIHPHTHNLPPPTGLQTAPRSIFSLQHNPHSFSDYNTAHFSDRKSS